MKRQQLHRKKCSLLQLSVVLVLLLPTSPLAQGVSTTIPNIRIGTATNKFPTTSQLAVAFELTSPKFFRARHVEVAIGAITTSTEQEGFISFGPVWRVPGWNEYVYFDFGFSPTWLSRSSFDGRDVGGNFHFTSALSMGARLGRRKTGSIALRFQHMSNGGLDSTNPGLDMVGVEISFGVSR